ncbi:MAG: hypothetical protein ACI8T1_004447 [Verrucomicrobiales bacterium]|jgi:hypothetical protein
MRGAEEGQVTTKVGSGFNPATRFAIYFRSSKYDFTWS